jgi:hypothetical protein
MMSALPPKADINHGERSLLIRANRNRLAEVSPRCDRVKLSQSARALRQAGAGPEGEVRLFLRCACSDLQRLIGDIEGEYLLFSLLKSHRDACHGVDPFCLWVAVARLRSA